jgi:GT2 family glycosyltransferase
MDLSIIIVNWNSTDFTRKCISSILSTTRNLEYEIIVVDNASADDSYRRLCEQSEKVRLIGSPENVGFARANNLGFRGSFGKYVLFLNPDTETIGPAINLMYSCLESSPTVGAAGCKLLNADLSVQTSCVQRFPTIFNQVTDIEWLRLRFPNLGLWGIRPLFSKDPDIRADVEVLAGACVMLRREVFETIGYFSTDYFMYAEDIDLCYKIMKAGWKLRYVGSGSIVHYGKQSSTHREEDSFAVVVMRESVFKFLRKTKGPVYAQIYRLSLLLVAVLRLPVFAFLLAVPSSADNKISLRGSSRKWWKILRWSVGLEAWTKRLGTPFNTDVVTARN